MVDEDKLANLTTRQKTYGDILQNTTKDELKFLLEMFHNEVPQVMLAVREKVVAKGRQLFFPPAFYERNLDFYTPCPFSMRIQSLAGSDILDLAGVILAASCGNLAFLKTAQESGVDLDRSDYDMRTALHYSCAGDYKDCVRFLVEEAMVTLDSADRWGMTPQDYAKAVNNTEMMEYLAQKQRVEKKVEKIFPKIRMDNEKMIEKFFT